MNLKLKICLNILVCKTFPILRPYKVLGCKVSALGTFEIYQVAVTMQTRYPFKPVCLLSHDNNQFVLPYSLLNKHITKFIRRKIFWKGESLCRVIRKVFYEEYVGMTAKHLFQCICSHFQPSYSIMQFSAFVRKTLCPKAIGT